MTKAALRTEVRQSRRERSARSTIAAGVAIADRMLALPEITDAIASGRAVATYLAMPTEPPTKPLVDALHAVGATVFAPRVAGEEMEWVELTPDGETRRSTLGIDEPTSAAAARGGQLPLDCAVVVMPALAVDATGRRLGQGGGFYDRALAGPPRTSSPPLLVVLVFDDEVVTQVPTEPHDVSVDMAVTPTRVIRFHTPAS